VSYSSFDNKGVNSSKIIELLISAPSRNLRVVSVERNNYSFYYRAINPSLRLDKFIIFKGAYATWF